MTNEAEIDGAAFRHLLGHYPTGVCAITAMGLNGAAYGMLVGSFTSVSLEPPLVAFLPDKKSTTWQQIERIGRFCVNILADDQQDLCRRFSAKGTDKFADLSHRHSRNGSPVLDDVVAWIDCSLYGVHEAGDHFIVLGRISEFEIVRAERPLLFFRGRYGGISQLEPN